MHEERSHDCMHACSPTCCCYREIRYEGVVGAFDIEEDVIKKAENASHKDNSVAV